MAASRNAQLAQPYFERPATEEWQRRRLELLRPEQEQRLARRRWEAVPYVLLVALILVFAFAYMCLDAQIGLAGRQINDLDAQTAQMQTQSLRTEVEIGNLSSLSRIESYAKLHLNMVYPDIQAVQYLDQRVSQQLAVELSGVKAAAPVPAAEPAPQYHPLLAAWAELIDYYFSGTALATNQ